MPLLSLLSLLSYLSTNLFYVYLPSKLSIYHAIYLNLSIYISKTHKLVALEATLAHLSEDISIKINLTINRTITSQVELRSKKRGKKEKGEREGEHE